MFGNFAPIFLNRESYMVILTEGYGAEYAATLNKMCIRDSLCTYQDRQKAPYDYKDFYTFSTDKECDIFRCEENGLLYVPGKNELFKMCIRDRSQTVLTICFYWKRL